MSLLFQNQLWIDGVQSPSYTISLQAAGGYKNWRATNS